MVWLYAKTNRFCQYIGYDEPGLLQLDEDWRRKRLIKVGFRGQVTSSSNRIVPVFPSGRPFFYFLVEFLNTSRRLE